MQPINFNFKVEPVDIIKVERRARELRAQAANEMLAALAAAIRNLFRRRPALRLREGL